MYRAVTPLAFQLAVNRSRTLWLVALSGYTPIASSPVSTVTGQRRSGADIAVMKARRLTPRPAKYTAAGFLSHTRSATDEKALLIPSTPETYSRSPSTSFSDAFPAAWTKSS